jgi:hypothetical protein
MLLGSGERRELNDLRRLPHLPCFRALPINAMARNRQSSMKVVQLFCVEPDGLLSAPAQAICPCRMAQDDLLATRVLLN